MRVTPDMIDKDLRRRAKLLSLSSNMSENGMRRMGRVQDALARVVKPKTPKHVEITEEWITRADGSRLRLVVAKPLVPQENVPGVLWIHGGGYAFGNPEGEMKLFGQLIEQCDGVVVAPDYRLSLEVPYPAALDDCYAALLWLRDNAGRLGVRDDQLAVCGGSAGGGLTAAVTLYARDKGEVAVAFQMPLFPMIDDRSITESARENNVPVWDAVTNVSAWKIYLGALYGTEDVPAYAAPSRANDFSGLPPTLTYVGDLDTFHDETVDYVERLRAAGVPVEFKIFPGCYHGWEAFVPKARISGEVVQFRNRWFRQAVATYFAAQPKVSSKRR